MARIDIDEDGTNSAALPTTGTAGNSVLISGGNTLACFVINMSGASIDITVETTNGSTTEMDYDGLYDMAGGATDEVRGVYNIDVKRLGTLTHTSGANSGDDRGYRVKIQPGATFAWTTQNGGTGDVHVLVQANGMTTSHETGATLNQDVWVLTNQ